MATQEWYELHTRAGLRWLAPMVLALLAVVTLLFVMLVYPYIST